MKNTFTINHSHREIIIEQHPADKYNNNFFTVHLPEEDLQIECTEDDEGAIRWLDMKTNHQTELSAELGHLIDRYLAANKKGT